MEWQVWCHPKAMLRHPVLKMSYLWLTWYRISVRTQICPCFHELCLFHLRAIKAHTWKKTWGHSDLKLHSSACLYYLCPLITRGSGQQMKKEWCNQMPHLFSPWLTKRKCPRWMDRKPIGVYWSMPSLMNPSRTSVMFRHVKECFDFWDVWVRAGPTSNLPAVWLQYQTIALNYSKVLDLRALFFCRN